MSSESPMSAFQVPESVGSDKVAQSVTQAAMVATHEMHRLKGISVAIQVVLGSAAMTISELLELQPGTVVSLDRRVGEPVRLLINGRPLASGELVVIEGENRFGVKLTSIDEVIT